MCRHRRTLVTVQRHYSEKRVVENRANSNENCEYETVPKQLVMSNKAVYKYFVKNQEEKK